MISQNLAYLTKKIMGAIAITCCLSLSSVNFCISIFFSETTESIENKRFPYQMMLVPVNSNTTGVTFGTNKELLTLPEHPSSPEVFWVFRIAWSLVFCVVFRRSLFVLLSFFFWLCIVCPLIYSFWLPLCYLQIVLGRYVHWMVFFKVYDFFYRNVTETSSSQGAGKVVFLWVEH